MTANITSTQMIAAKVAIANHLKSIGYGKFKLSDIVSKEDVANFAMLCRAVFPSLQDDPYTNGDTRKRGYTRLLYNPQNRRADQIDFEDGKTAYFQIEDHNPEPHAAGVKRRFPSLAPSQAENPALNSIIQSTALICQIAGMLNQTSPNLVGVHFIRMCVETPGQEALGVPPILHTDGERATLAILWNLQNCFGGENLIAKRHVAGKHPSEISKDDEIEWFNLEETFDCWIIDDSKISHYVSPVKMRDENGPRAERDIILIDFCPCVPVLTEGVK